MRIASLALAAISAIVPAAITPAAAQNATLREMAALRLTSMIYQSEQARRFCGVSRDQEQAFQTRIAAALAAGGLSVPLTAQPRDGGNGNTLYTSGQPDPSRPHMIVTAVLLHGGAGEAGVCSVAVLARITARLPAGATTAGGLALPQDVSFYVDDHTEIGAASNGQNLVAGAGIQIASQLLEQRRQTGGR